MNYTITIPKEKLPQETQEHFSTFVQAEINTRSPDDAVKALYSDEPEQLSFDFPFSPETDS